MTGAGCMAALDAEHYLQGVGVQQDKSDWLASEGPELRRSLIRSNVWWNLPLWGAIHSLIPEIDLQYFLAVMLTCTRTCIMVIIGRM